MGEGKQQIMAVQMHAQNPIEQFQAKYKEIEDGFKNWLAKQSLPVEAAVITATNFAQGAFLGALLGNFSPDLSSSMPSPPPGANFDPNVMNAFQQAQVHSYLHPFVFCMCVCMHGVLVYFAYLLG